MADALLSSAVGAAGWAVSAGLIAYSSRKLNDNFDEKRVPLMGVLAAFIFAAQMINFTIPATGSSGHLAGALLLAFLLGPYAGFISIASVLTVQAFFFADGGILALGCNMINMGAFACFIVYPVVKHTLLKDNPTKSKIIIGSVLGSIIGLQMGAFAVVLETRASGISELPFGTFLLLMQPVHLAIGVVEGVVTATVVLFVWGNRPELLTAEKVGSHSITRVIVSLLVAAVFTGGVLSWFASANPDGLEWSMFKTSGQEELAAPDRGLYNSLNSLQENSSFLPGYDFKPPVGAESSDKAWGSVSAGTSLAGILGSLITLVLTFAAGVLFRKKSSLLTAKK
nr:energy-coupling factor ABC transporter permease [Denitrovibrio acetiphilus]